MSTNWPRRLYTLDISRGLAALAVVLWHWQHFGFKGYIPGPGFVREDQPLYSVLKLFYKYGSMGVPYFFMLSGFIFFWLYSAAIQSRTIGLYQFSVQRFSRTLPLISGYIAAGCNGSTSNLVVTILSIPLMIFTTLYSISVLHHFGVLSTGFHLTHQRGQFRLKC